MLHVGDRVVYPMHGAGTISGIEECEIMGEKKMYYVLKMPIGNMKVMLPTDNIDNIGLRDVSSPATVDEVIIVLHNPPEKLLGSWNKRFHANLDKLKTGNICQVAEVARNLILQDKVKKVSSGERRLLDLSKQILVSELVYACSKTPEEVDEWLQEQLKDNGFK